MQPSIRIFISIILFGHLFPTITAILSQSRPKSRPKPCPEACRPYLSNVICGLPVSLPRIDILTLEFSTIFGIRPISLIENLHGVTNQSINFVFNSDGYPKIYDVISGRRIDPDVLIASGIYVTVDLAVDFTICGREGSCRFKNGQELADFLTSREGRALFGVRSSFAYVHVPETKDKVYIIAGFVGISIGFMVIGAVYTLVSCYRSKFRQISRSTSTITTVSFIKTDNDTIEDLQMQLSTNEHPLGQTIFHLAVIKKLSAIIPVLIERGFDLNAQRNDEESPLSLAVGMNSLSCVDELLKIDSLNVNHFIGPNDMPLKRAIAMGNVGLPIVKALLSRPDIDINAVGDRCNCLSLCQTPMHTAVIFGNVAALKELLKMGADRRIADEEQKIPMQYALERGNVEIIGLLMDRPGENVFDIDSYSNC
uniref:ANK_REP_REGION domain-containing protein n=1 Tax=Panagrellus redivivus TaxID=6233 RepID=A0A7E4V677_PANRE